MKISHLFNRLTRVSACAEENPIARTRDSDSIDSLLAQLSVFGDPKLIKMDTGWWCFIEVTGAIAGTRLTVSSANHHTGPASAVAECLQRVQDSGLPHRAQASIEKPVRW